MSAVHTDKQGRSAMIRLEEGEQRLTACISRTRTQNASSSGI